jgi:hypothetical protein
MQPRDNQGRFTEIDRNHGILLAALTQRSTKHAGLVKAIYPDPVPTDAADSTE